MIILLKFLRLTLLISFCFHGAFHCDQNRYAVDKISSILRTGGGSAIIRVKEEIFKVDNASYATYQVKYAITVFNKEGQHFGTLKLSYDNFRSIEDLAGTIYNSKGDVVRELKESDIKDYSAFDDVSIYTDSRIKVIEMYSNDFPYTVEFIYEYSFDGYLNWPTWYSRNYLDAVEFASFKVITPSNYNLRYWCNNENVNPIKNKVDDSIEYLWQTENLPKLAYDAVGEDIEDIATIVRIAPTDFEIDSYPGNMSSWKDFGLWFYNLYKDQTILPQNAIKEIENKVSSIESVSKKIDILYKYMQSRTHYVSVQLGIGGWKPFDVSYVYTNGYGDCKALSNFMVNILKVADISAYPVLINNGQYRTPLVTEFPSNQFNHVIVCIPLSTDTIWLECTSQIMPTGMIGSNNENRDALMITPKGGVIIKTPISKAQQNSQLKNIDVILSSSGGAKINSRIRLSGDQAIGTLHTIRKTNSEQKVKWLRNFFEVPGMELQNYKFDLSEELETEIGLNMEVAINRYAAISGNRYFFNPNLIERRTYVPKSVDKRLSPIRFDYPYFDSDSIHFLIPDSYEVEALPNEINIQSSFGSFTSRTISLSENEIQFVRVLSINTYSIPAEFYDEYQKFFAEVVKADKQQVVLVKE